MKNRIVGFHRNGSEGISPNWDDTAIREALLEPDHLVHHQSETLMRVKYLDGEEHVLRFHTPNGATLAQMACCAANAWDELYDDLDVRITYLLMRSDQSWDIFWKKTFKRDESY